MQSSLERLRQRREEGVYEGGFTLIELLIVIVILGILAAIVVFAVQNLSGSSATAACQADYKTAETALEAFKAQEGAYPNSTQGIAVLTTTIGSNGPWLKDALPTTTSGGSQFKFKYVAPTDSTGNYALTATGVSCPT